MRIATWNVNSVKSRMPRLLAWLAERDPDVLLVQETKSSDEAWPAGEFSALGYESAHLGTGRWNGVAVLSRVGLEHVTLGVPGQPTFEGLLEPRAVGASCGGVRLWSLYVPNGRKAGSPHYAYKLAFLDAVRAHAALEQEALGGAPLGLLGDFNVAPADADVWDPAALAGGTHVSVDERDALARLREGVRLTDLLPRASVRPDDERHPWTFWEMRMLGFQKGRGMRLDLALVNDALRRATTDAWVDRDARRGEAPSDHAPLVLDLQLD